MADTPVDADLVPVPTLEVGALLTRLDRGERILLLDVRNEEEFDSWRIEARQPVETVHVPYFDFVEDADASIAKVPRDRDVVVLCAQGGSSEMVAGMLQGAGIASANIMGGMIAYGVYLEPVRVPLAPEEAARFELWQVNRRGKACLSYVIVSGREAAVVDPSRHVSWYEAFVAGRGARIVRVLDTHVHADHVSGGPAIARALGAPYFVAAGEGFEIDQPVTPLADGQRVSLGGEAGVSIEVRVLSTPGHTPGSTSFLVDGTYLLTGDTLFVASVGRPDLGGHVVEWGHALFDTLRRRLGDLPAATCVLPAHYSGMSEISREGVVWGRLGELRRSVPEMQIATADAFVEAVRSALKEQPKAYSEIIKVNLGAAAPEEKISEWELGKNQCAASARTAGA
jgi:glyoxylase-like metal-dependent hydrolase (beta-lactamase superfamily II)/rhodanese-related sulfurtransferase